MSYTKCQALRLAFLFLRGADRSCALRGNASGDAPRSSLRLGRGASRAAFPRRAWERSVGARLGQNCRNIEHTTATKVCSLYTEFPIHRRR
ncbi:hypothetical protein DMX03_25735 [Pseudomonas koreensis]|nr:hypothetical protein DMX03_25735 [Pseudomonas koreensis]